MSVNPVRAQRISTDPIVIANSVAGYGPIFNAGVIWYDDRFHLFARAVRLGYTRNAGDGARFLNYVSDIIVMTSIDGRHYEFEYVLAAPSEHVAALEDPRVQWVSSDGYRHLVMTYTELPCDPAEVWRIGAARLDWVNGRFEVVDGSTVLLGPEGIANKDAVVFNLADGRVAMIHRIHPNMQLAVFDSLDHLWHASDDYWRRYLAQLEMHVILTPTPGALGIGAGAPPIGFGDVQLLFFHERDATGRYTAKVALLDAASGRVRSLLDEPVLVPELAWEIEGDVDDVVFVQGAHIKPDGSVYLTYGAADRCVGAAVVQFDQIEVLLSGEAA